MALITGTALAYVVWQGAVRIVSSKLAKELVKVGAKYLTKKNFKKSYEFFKGNKKIKTSEKNKILEDLNIVTPKVSKVSKVSKVPKSSTPGIKSGESLQAYFARMAKETKAPKKPEVKKPEAPKTEVKKPEAPKTEVKKPEIPKSDKPVSSEKLHTQVKEHLQSGGSADRGAKIVEEVTKPSLKSQMREILLPNPITKPIRSTFTYGTYGIAGTKVKSMMSDEAADAIERVKLENEKIKKDKEAKEKKIYKKKIDETTLGVIDLNTIVDQEQKWKLDNSGNYVVE